VHGPRRLAVGLAAATAVITLNVPAAGAVTTGAGSGPWCTGTSTVCHSWDSFHANQLQHMRDNINRIDARNACKRAISLHNACDRSRWDTHRHWTPWRTYVSKPVSQVFNWNGWRSFQSWQFWNWK